MKRLSEQALLIFTRNPEPGKCKTRLAATIGDQAALDIYLHLLRHTAQVCSRMGSTDKFVYYSEYEGDGTLWDPSVFIPELQQGADLGVRMNQAFEKAFKQGYRKVILIGSDLPDLSSGDLQQAFKQLDDHDAVVGPASDGGYYLIGLKGPMPELFEKKDWGEDQVLKDTLADLSEIPVYLLSEKNDVDRYEDIAGRPEFQTYLTATPDDPETAG